MLSVFVCRSFQAYCVAPCPAKSLFAKLVHQVIARAVMAALLEDMLLHILRQNDTSACIVTFECLYVLYDGKKIIFFYAFLVSLALCLSYAGACVMHCYCQAHKFLVPFYKSFSSHVHVAKSIALALSCCHVHRNCSLLYVYIHH